MAWLIGTMNHPERDPVREIEWMAGLGLDFIDLTLEPPLAASWSLDIEAVRKALVRFGMKVVGHTSWYLPLASAIPELRRGALEELPGIPGSSTYEGISNHSRR